MMRTIGSAAVATPTYDALIFDFDGTLVDSDEALVVAFEHLGVDRATVTFGHAIGEELARLGLRLEDYAQAYDVEVVQPFDGVREVVGRLGRWAVCSNKHPDSAMAELARLDWRPEVALFADDFGWAHKRVEPVLELLDLPADRVAVVGDSEGDLRCATEAGCDMYWAGWNPRVPDAVEHGTVLERPVQLLDLYA
jgi:HAD superfamily hydrolase (TIGR01549 family)